jgi:predicted dehydrogenase
LPQVLVAHLGQELFPLLTQGVVLMTVDRRQFLQQSAVVGTALAASTLVRPAQSRYAANDTIVVAVMGVNGRGASLARSFARLPGSAVACVCDVDDRAAAKCAQLLVDDGHQQPQQVRDFRKILDDPSIDALVCAAPDHWHAPATILACKAGKHVYVEKPCSHNPREGELAVAAARKYNRVVQMGNQRRSWPKIIEAMELLHSGAIGRVYYSRAWYANTRGSIGRGRPVDVPTWLDWDLWQGPAPERSFHDNVVHYNWHWFWHWGTGEIGNNGVHGLDLSRWGLGVDYPIRITSGGGRYHWTDDQETPDTHVVTFEFEGGRMICWEGLSCNRDGIKGNGFGASFHGEQGTLIVGSDGAGYAHYDKNYKLVNRVTGPGTDDAHILNFLDAIRGQARLNSDIEEGHKSTLLCQLGNIAHRVGRTIHLDPITRQIVGDPEAQQYWSREYRAGWEPTL